MKNISESERNALKGLVIDESNFDQYFFDTRNHGPQPGQVLACYEAQAEFVDGHLKRDIIHMLLSKDNAGEITVRLMQKLAGATHNTALATIKSMARDLLNGMSTDAVAIKPYEFQCRHFFYTYRECLPDDDPHWWSTSLVDVKYDEDKLETILSSVTDHVASPVVSDL